ncbi:MAG: PKD domain-containing protein [Candidatus Thermoplasmatota archaeon]|nr:PKD domain-containing protein [Candidatus Thermoplasmatota archaeon]
MKKILPIILIGVFLLSSIGVTALQNTPRENTIIVEATEPQMLGNRDYTHTVLVEVGTATWCSSCPASNAAWHSIYGGGNYDFEYCEMVIDKNSVANAHMGTRNLYWVPTSYFDGGEFVHPGTSYPQFYTFLDSSGSRPVADIVASMTAVWLDHNQLEIYFEVSNNEIVNYPGQLKIYIVELESERWNDYNGNPYHHAFLDFAFDQQINIPASGSITDTITWDKVTNGHSSLRVDNTQVILAVYDDEPHTSYSDPPSGAPFTAYYVDETIATSPTFENTDPDSPHIEGKINGKAGVDYTYSICSSDPDGDPMYYCIDWGDGTPEVCIGPFPSGVCTTASHNWTEQGDYTIKVKARDVYDAESDWGTLDISMPLNQQAPLGWFLRFLENYPRVFPILRTLLGL